MAGMPRLLIEARQNPMVLRRLLPHFIVATLLEPLLSAPDFLFHLETVAFYAAGWMLDATARLVEVRSSFWYMYVTIV